ncbi:hypothetical protein [Nocardia sp. NBC_01388]|uniref:hypothetical protein n=1 Tax=Nocardia sp. NBC_01388 TaxID=2903596 RepID=UPI002F90EE49
MTALDEAPDDSRQEYAWGLAPSHLVTRRQLRERGKSPGKSAVALMIGKAWGKRVAAVLFDPALAPDKRPASPAQRASAAKATLARQIKAAERRGITAEELTTESDPGPGWADPDSTTPSQEENIMSDNTSQTAAAAEKERVKSLSQRLRELDPNGRYAGKSSGWAMADEVFTELLDAGLDPETLVDKVRRGTRNGYQASILMRSIQDNTAHRTPDQSATPAPNAVPEQQIRPEPAAPAAESTAAAVPKEEPPSTPADTSTALRGTYGQRMAFLVTSVAMHQSLQQRIQLDEATALQQALAEAPEGFEDAARLSSNLAWLRQDIANFRAKDERLLATSEWPQGPEGEAAVLAAALTWFDSGEEPLASSATRWVSSMDAHFAQGWGIDVGSGEWKVTFEEGFDAGEVQQFREADVVFARANAAFEVLGSMKNVPERVLEAVAAWRGEEGMTAEMTEQYLAGESDRHAQLTRDLGSAGLHPDLRAGVQFIVDYARGDVASTDLLKTPILVNPAEEVRGRVPNMLDTFAKNKAHAAIIGTEIAVMTEPDRERVRAAGKQIAAGEQVDTQLWPGWVNRSELDSKVRTFARTAREVAVYADALSTGEVDNIDDDIQVELASMVDDRRDIRAMLDLQGVHPIEKAQVLAVLADIDTGRIDDRTLPQVLLIDERSKQEADWARHGSAAEQIGDQAVSEATEVLERDKGRALNPRSAVSDELDKVGRGLGCVAQGGHDSKELTRLRERHSEGMGKLGQALAAAEIEVPARMRVRAIIDTSARKAGQHGRSREERDKLWTNRIRSGAATAARAADAQAQHAAVEAGQAHLPERACAKRPDPSAGQTTPTGPAARVSRLHHSEVGR